MNRVGSRAERSPKTRARIAGIYYLLTIVTGALALFVHGPLLAALLLISTGCYIVVTWLFYWLFRPVNRGISAIAAGFSLIGCALSILALLHLAPSRPQPIRSLTRWTRSSR